MIACLYLPGSSQASALVALSQDFSPRFEVLSREVVLIDVSGLGRLVGDADAVGAAICRLARARKLPVIVALAPTRTAALLVALADRVPGASSARREPYHLMETDIATALAPLPLSLLAALHRVESGVEEESSDPAGGWKTRPSTMHPRRRGRGRGSCRP
jgi:hypothetical protein